MKKYFYMVVAAIAVLSSCSNDNEFEPNQSGKQGGLVFTATMEGSEGTRATYNSINKCAEWEKGDKININGKTYSAQTAGTTTTFKADNGGATGETYNAYFPADLYDGTTATLPAIQTYTAGKFNMPMYATSTTTTLAFKNLCAVLAIKVTSADITTLKSIKVASDQKMNGKFTVDENNTAVINDDNGTNVVVLESSTALTLDETGTTFYIAIPAQDYMYLNIFLSADGTTYTQAMATKKAAGLGTIARSRIFNIDYARNAVRLWQDGPYFADRNLGASSPTDGGSKYRFSETGPDDAAAKAWGVNWRVPTKIQVNNLDAGFKMVQYSSSIPPNPSGIYLYGKADGYSMNSVFFPCSYDTYQVPGGGFETSLTGSYFSGTTPYQLYTLCVDFDDPSDNVGRTYYYIRYTEYQYFTAYVRPVLAE